MNDQDRRDRVETLRRGMLRNMTFATPGGSFADTDFLVSSDGVKWSFLDSLYGMFGRPTYAEIARDLGINDEHLRLILLGKREPSAAFLEAAGYERVVFYRRKDRPNV